MPDWVTVLIYYTRYYDVNWHFYYRCEQQVYREEQRFSVIINNLMTEHKRHTLRINMLKRIFDINDHKTYNQQELQLFSIVKVEK